MATYYIDLDNGNDGSAGTSTGTAWKKLDKFIEGSRSPGDIGYVRRDTGQTMIASDSNIAVASNGDVTNPIKLYADNGESGGWAETVSPTSTSMTTTFGSKTATTNADDTTPLTADSNGNRWVIFRTGESPYEVESYSFSAGVGTVTLYLPYRGDDGATTTAKILKANPVLNFGGNSFKINFQNDKHWHLRGLTLSTSTESSNAALYCSGTGSHRIFEDMIFIDNNTALSVRDGVTVIRECRFEDNQKAISRPQGIYHTIENCLVDGTGSTYSTHYGIHAELNNGGQVRLYNYESKNCTGDIYGKGNLVVLGRNVKLESTTKITQYISTGGVADLFDIRIEDWAGTVGDNRVFSNLDETEGVASIQSEDTTVRSGGGSRSLKITPGSNMGTTWGFTEFELFSGARGVPFQVSAVAKTVEVYFNLPSADFTTAPTTTELYFEVEYWASSTNNLRKVLQTTGTVLADGNWNAITATFTPGQAGVAYLRVYYAKAKESGKSNVFYVDPMYEVT